MAASMRRSTAEVSLPLPASVGTSRETITRGHSASAAGSVEKRMRSRAAAKSLRQPRLVHGQLAAARAARPARDRDPPPMTGIPSEAQPDARDDPEVRQPEEAGRSRGHAPPSSEAAAAASMVRESQRSFSRDVRPARGAAPRSAARSPRPRLVRAGHRLAGLLGHAAGEAPAPDDQLAAAPLGEPVHLQGAPVARHLDAPAILPGKEAALDHHGPVGGGEDAVIQPLQLVAPPLPHPELGAEASEDEAGEVDEVAGHVLEDAEPAVAPGAHDVPGGAVAVEHPRAVDAPDRCPRPDGA